MRLCATSKLFRVSVKHAIAQSNSRIVSRRNGESKAETCEYMLAAIVAAIILPRKKGCVMLFDMLIAINGIVTIAVAVAKILSPGVI